MFASVHHVHVPPLQIISCNPNWMCFSFTQNNPKQLQGNSAQSSVSQVRAKRGSSSRRKSTPFRPWSILYGITVITLWAPCSCHTWLPFGTAQYNSIFHYLIILLGNNRFSVGCTTLHWLTDFLMLFDACYFDTPALCEGNQWLIPRFRLSRKMMG